MIKFFKYFLFLLIGVRNTLPAQNKKIDSLLSVLKTAQVDTNKVKALNDLAMEFRNNHPDTAVYFAKKAFEIASKINYQKGVLEANLMRGIALGNLGKYEEAFKHLAFVIQAKGNNQKVIARAYNAIGLIYKNQGNYPDALKNYSAALKLREELLAQNKNSALDLEIRRSIASSYASIGHVYYYQDNYTEVLKNHVSALKIREKLLEQDVSPEVRRELNEGIAASYNIIGAVYYHQGNYREALKNYFTSLKIDEKAGNSKGVASCYNNIGNVQKDLGNYPEALENHFNALKIRESSPGKTDRHGIAESYNNIGILYSNQGDYPMSLKNHFASLKIKEEIGDMKGVSDSYGNIGNVYHIQGNYSLALKNYFACLKISEQNGDKKGAASSYNDLGVIYYDLGDYKKSLENHLVSLKIKEERGDKHGIASSYINIGSLYTKMAKTISSPVLQQAKFKEAEKYETKALLLFKEIEVKNGIKTCYRALAEIDSAIGDYKGAYNNHKMYIIYRDSLLNEENTKKTVQTQMQYEFDKKENAAKDLQEKKDLQANADKRRQRAVLILVAFVLLLVIFFTGFIFRALRVTRKQKGVIESQKKIVEEHQKEIIDSIRYAKRIQTALLPSEKYITRHLK